jgi:hypothetical protein
MDSHLSRCLAKTDARKLEAQAYFSHNTNSGTGYCETDTTSYASIQKESEVDEMEHITCLSRVLAQSGCIHVQDCPHSAVKVAGDGGGGGVNMVGVPKHMAQHQAILTFLRIVQRRSTRQGESGSNPGANGDGDADAAASLRGESTGSASGDSEAGTLVEFGAGKGMLTLDLLRAEGSLVASRVVLVERQRIKTKGLADKVSI